MVPYSPDNRGESVAGSDASTHKLERRETNIEIKKQTNKKLSKV